MRKLDTGREAPKRWTLCKLLERAAALDALENATKIVDVSSLKNFLRGTPEYLIQGR